MGSIPEVCLSSAPGDGRLLFRPHNQTCVLRVHAGGYLEYIFRAAAAQLFGKEVEAGPLPLRTLRNADFQEVSLDVGGRPALRFAIAYGFRNIQTLVRPLHYSPSRS